MSVRIITNTQFGPFQAGSNFKVSPNYAQALVRQYGFNVRIQSNYPGAYWFQDGAVLTVNPVYVPPVPGPFPPQPIPPVQGTINVRFISQVQDPTSGQVYQAGPLYKFTVSGLRTLNNRVGGLVFSTDMQQNNQVSPSQLQLYTGRTLYVDQAIFAYRTQPDYIDEEDLNAYPL